MFVTKNKLKVLLGFLMIFLFLPACKAAPTEFSDMCAYLKTIYPNVRDVDMSEWAEYDFNYLRENSDVIALVKAADKLSEENTHGIIRQNTTSIAYFYEDVHSFREIQVREFFENRSEVGERFTICQTCGIDPAGDLVYVRSAYPLQKDSTYLVFLHSALNGKYASCGYNTYDLTHLCLNDFSNRVQLPAILSEYGLLTKESLNPYGDDIERLKQFHPYDCGAEVKNVTGPFTEIVLTTQYTEKGMELRYYKAETETGCWYLESPDAEWGLFLTKADQP